MERNLGESEGWEWKFEKEIGKELKEAKLEEGKLEERNNKGNFRTNERAQSCTAGTRSLYQPTERKKRTTSKPRTDPSQRKEEESCSRTAVGER